MFKAFLSFCILFSAAILLAVQPVPLTLQEKFDKIAEQETFGEKDVTALRAVMAAEKESGEKVNCTFCPDTLTWYLATNGFIPEATWLLDHNADFGIKDKDGMTLLHAVCRAGEQEFAELLIKRGAEINLPDNDGRTAIHYAVMSGNSKLVESLLNLGSDPNKLTKKKETPLHFAAKYSGIEEVQFLIEHGASIKAINWKLIENLKEQRRRQDMLYVENDEDHIIALKSALGLKTPEAIGRDEEDDEDDEEDEEEEPPEEEEEKPDILHMDYLPFEYLPRDTVDAATEKGLTALHYAAEKGDLEVVKFLVEHGADIKAEDLVLSRSVIHFAAENGHLDCIKYLTEKGANLLDRDSFGATAMHYAARSNKLEVIKFLVDRKIDYRAKDARGWSAMHYAAEGGSIDVVRYLLAKGLNINELNEDGRTPLFFARNHHDLRVFMISKGAR